MTDAAVICTWMSGPPVVEQFCDLQLLNSWWRWSTDLSETPCVTKVVPCKITLDDLWAVEERLTEKQAWNYLGALQMETADVLGYGFRHLWHATAEQKIAALAAILRPIVETA